MIIGGRAGEFQLLNLHTSDQQQQTLAEVGKGKEVVLVHRAEAKPDF